MPNDESSIVTVLFTDQVRSTDLAQRLGDDAADELRLADFALLRDALARHGGEEVKTIGDSVMAVFRSALGALSCAVAMQRAVERANRTRMAEDATLLRVGIDAGEPIRREGDYWGTPIVVARRLCDSASGGQILVSDLVRRLAGLRGTHEYREVGAITLKGFAEPIHPCELLWEAGEDEPTPIDGAFEPVFPSWLWPRQQTRFVNRERELQRLRERWAQARDGARQVVVLAGDAGIGKTRMATEIALYARGEGADVYAARCESSPGHRASLQEQLGDLPTALGRGGARGDRRPGTASDARSAGPCVVIVDDAHQADDADIAYIRRVVMATAGCPTLLLLTVRGTAPGSGALPRMFSELRQQDAFERILVGGIPRDVTSDLIREWAGHASPAEFAFAVHERTNGNPFFIEEMLRHLSETDAIYEEDGRIATTVDIEEMDIPEGVRALIVERLSLLSEECNRLLSVASVIGSEFDIEALERASHNEGGRTVQLLEEAIAAGLVEEVECEEERYRFSHSLIRETVYDGLTEARRIRVHRESLRYASPGGTRIAYEVLGSAGPVLLACGLSNCPAARVRSRAATARWERMTRFCRVILYDRRGVGSSDTPERGYSLRASIDDVRAILDAEGVGRAILWGATDGGPLAMLFAATYPERVAGMILMGTGARMLNGDGWNMGINPAALESFYRMESLDQSSAITQLTRVRRTGDTDAHAIMRMMRRIRPEAWAKIRGCIGSSDVRGLLPELRTPTLILHDRSNDYIPFEAAEHLQANIAGSRLEETDELVAPVFGPALYETIEGFVRRVTGDNEV